MLVHPCRSSDASGQLTDSRPVSPALARELFDAERFHQSAEVVVPARFRGWSAVVSGLLRLRARLPKPVDAVVIIYQPAVPERRKLNGGSGREEQIKSSSGRRG